MIRHSALPVVELRVELGGAQLMAYSLRANERRRMLRASGLEEEVFHVPGIVQPESVAPWVKLIIRASEREQEMPFELLVRGNGWRLEERQSLMRMKRQFDDAVRKRLLASIDISQLFDERAWALTMMDPT